ncbi:TRAP transporter small permease subunit [Consotaella salsifontis]|uniref:TRAP transporter small permease protein n=1 Tax=Consotaella salsifontis TaxID=1365950 RepID=A0A1T4T410_9HYPH|nr:TRAP transporter small permease subunit [Consotaella salsifontis]SKA35029.1 TRAP-type mannitol/chloroaromatic compound transport system, small permease component [Consotaella salsifontis]
MTGLLTLSHAIDRVTAWIGKSVSWLILAAILVSAVNAALRKAFDISSNAWLELQWYLFGAVFMLATAWTLQRNDHVRIDVLSSRFSPRARNWIDLVCHILFLMPFAILMTWLSWSFFWRSFFSGERSMNAGGLLLWPAKGLILLGFIVLIAQGVSEIIKRVAVLSGHRHEVEEPDEEDIEPEAGKDMDPVISWRRGEEGAHTEKPEAGRNDA